MRRIAILAVLVAFTFSCGGEWAVLQGIAWANMIREYSEAAPFAQAVRMTFSGDYPCPLCKAIAEKRQSEKIEMAALHKQEKQVCPSGLVSEPRRASISPQTFVAWESAFASRTDAPPTPPPRFA